MATQMTYHVDVRRHHDGTFHNITRQQSMTDATQTAAMLNIVDRAGGEYLVREYTGRPDGCHYSERQS